MGEGIKPPPIFAIIFARFRHKMPALAKYK